MVIKKSKDVNKRARMMSSSGAKTMMSQSTPKSRRKAKRGK